MACVAVVVSLFLLIYRDSYLKAFAKSYSLVTFLLAITWVIQGIFMNVQNGTQARLVYSILLPMVFISQVAVINAFIVTFNLRSPRWFKLAWWAGLAFEIVSVLFRNEIYPILKPVPDGYFFESPPSDIGFSALKAVVYGSTLIGFVIVLWAGLRRQGNRSRWLYGLMILVYFASLVNDAVILQHHHTLYPTSWAGAGLLFVMLWRETHWHMREIYEQVNLDKFTGAYSRTFGENYLSECLKTQNVGMFYADIDNFKTVNDEYGHRAGDMALKLMMDLVKPVMQSPNLLVRLGGDEFLFLFPNANSDDEARLRARLESVLQDMRISGEDGRSSIPLKVSLGWAFARKGDSWLDVIHSADLAMYGVKEARRGNDGQMVRARRIDAPRPETLP